MAIDTSTSTKSLPIILKYYEELAAEKNDLLPMERVENTITQRDIESPDTFELKGFINSYLLNKIVLYSYIIFIISKVNLFSYQN